LKLPEDVPSGSLTISDFLKEESGSATTAPVWLKYGGYVGDAGGGKNMFT
jgi:hypothetical protein